MALLDKKRKMQNGLKIFGLTLGALIIVGEVVGLYLLLVPASK